MVASSHKTTPKDHLQQKKADKEIARIKFIEISILFI